jgi:hypothetical protein
MTLNKNHNCFVTELKRLIKLLTIQDKFIVIQKKTGNKKNYLNKLLKIHAEPQPVFAHPF